MATPRKNLSKISDKIPNKVPTKIPSNNKFMGFLKGIGVYLLIILAALVFFASLSNNGRPSDEVPVSQVVQDIKDGKVERVNLEGDKIVTDYKTEEGKAKRTVFSRKENGVSFYEVLKNADVDPKTVAIE